MNKILTISVLVMVAFSLYPVQPAFSDTFTGTDDMQTATFSVSTYARIDWSYVKENDYEFFNAFIYKLNEKYYVDQISDTNSGSTYLYDNGVFFFNVTTANLKSWAIKTTETNGDYVSDNDTIIGNYTRNTKLFRSDGNAEISWSYENSSSNFLFSLYLYKIGTPYGYKLLFKENVSYTLDQPGDYYLSLYAWRLNYYKITFNGTIPVSPSISPETSDTQTTATTGTTDTSSTHASTTIFSPPSKTSKVTTNVAFNITSFLILVPILAYSKKFRNE